MPRLSRDLLVAGLGLWLVLAPATAGATTTLDTAPGPAAGTTDQPAADPTGEPAAATSAHPGGPTTSSEPTTSPRASSRTGSRAGTPVTGPSSAARAVTVTRASEDETGTRAVDDAVLRWGVNDESNNRAFAPGTINFLSAGKVPDPGRGGSIMPASGWSARTGNVAVEKWDGSSYRPATWAGLRTDATGAALGNGRFSGHQLVFSAGEGTIDAANRSARIRWDGDASVVYYSGMSFFYLSDPELVVRQGVGTVTAELSGFASSMEDLSQWGPVAPKRVVVADLGPVSLGSPDDPAGGFTATPAYDGVRVSGVPQVRPYGAFPQSFVDFQSTLGTGAYWYSSGGAADPWKKALPMTISWAGADIAPPAPAPAAPAAPVDNPVRQRPAATRAPSSTGSAPAPAANLAPTGGGAPVAAALPTAASSTDLLDARPVATVVGSTAGTEDGAVLWWWLTATFLTLAAGAAAAHPLLLPRRPAAPPAPRG